MISICLESNNQQILTEIKRYLAESSLDEIYIRSHSHNKFNNIIIHYHGKNISKFHEIISKTISEIIITFYEPVLIDRILNLNYCYFSSNDKSILLDEFKLLQQRNIYNYKQVLSFIYLEVYQYIFKNKLMIITGFVNFRLSNYYHYLEQIISEAVKQYIIDKEYINFVNLLKKYVNSKVPSNFSLNLVYLNSNALLLSQSGDILKLDDFDSSYLSDISFSQNDYVLNTLVGILPKKINIHLFSPKDQFIKTIEMIFSDKVHFCPGCSLCKAYKLLNLT